MSGCLGRFGRRLKLRRGDTRLFDGFLIGRWLDSLLRRLDSSLESYDFIDIFICQDRNDIVSKNSINLNSGGLDWLVLSGGGDGLSGRMCLSDRRFAGQRGLCSLLGDLLSLLGDLLRMFGSDLMKL